MSYTLLIWEEVPDNHKLFMIPNEIADKYRHLLEEAHNRFINIDENNDGMNFLNVALEKEEYGNGQAHAGVLVNYLVDIENPISNVQITNVYLSGFVI